MARARAVGGGGGGVGGRALDGGGTGRALAAGALATGAFDAGGAGVTPGGGQEAISPTLAALPSTASDWRTGAGLARDSARSGTAVGGMPSCRSSVPKRGASGRLYRWEMASRTRASMAMRGRRSRPSMKESSSRSSFSTG